MLSFSWTQCLAESCHLAQQLTACLRHLHPLSVRLGSTPDTVSISSFQLTCIQGGGDDGSSAWVLAMKGETLIGFLALVFNMAQLLLFLAFGEQTSR